MFAGAEAAPQNAALFGNVGQGLDHLGAGGRVGAQGDVGLLFVDAKAHEVRRPDQQFERAGGVFLPSASAFEAHGPLFVGGVLQ